MSKPAILIVDDDDAFRAMMDRALRHRGYDVIPAPGGEEALRLVAERPVEAALVDLKMPGMDGLTLLGRLKEQLPDLPVLVLTGHGSIDSAVEATRLGAYHYLQKPCELADLEIHLRNALKSVREHDENIRLREAVRYQQGHATILGESPEIAALLRTIERVRDADAPVLIEGESGSGKELVARALHDDSHRCDEPFVAINCATLKPELLENELFGHQAGAFTGASRHKHGLLEIANKGTLFIDEIADMDPGVQASLLRVIETGTFRPLGSTREVTVYVRVVAASNRPLKGEVDANRFRRDLFYRLSVVVIEVPPLRQRLGDIRILADACLRRHAHGGRPSLSLSEEALKTLEAYPWPGNVRELYNVLERAVLLTESDVIDTADLRLDAPTADDGAIVHESDMSLQEMEARHIQRVLESHDGNVSHTAEVLGIDRRTLQRKMDRFSLRGEE